MDRGIFYSVGLGPGDPELLTFKAADIIANCEIIAVPDSGGEQNLALGIAARHIRGQVVKLPMPMTREAEALELAHAQAEAQITTLLDQGLSVAWITLGDPSIYSTAMYIHQRLTSAGYETRVIPGVPSFCAAAAALNTSLVQGDEQLHILPGQYRHLPGTTVLMKGGKELPSLLSQARHEQIMLVERASMADQRVYRAAAQIPEQPGYFSLAIIKAAPGKDESCPPATADDARPAAPPKEFFPLFVSSRDKKALIVGGGAVATRRALSLSQFDFGITVIAPRVSAELEELHRAGRITLHRREYRDGDIPGCFIAVAATDNRQLNHHIGELAMALGIWVSVADNSGECGFIFPALAVSERIVAGITSDGQDPHATKAAARRVRQALQEEL